MPKIQTNKENNIKDRLKKIREYLGLSQQEMADKLEVLVTTISKYERGVINPASNFLIKMVFLFNVDLNWLIAEQGHMFLDKDYIVKECCIEMIKEKVGFDNKEIDFILKEIIASPLLIETIHDFIKVKKGDKTALEQLKNVIKGIEFMIE